jgi:hypothetical protein
MSETLETLPLETFEGLRSAISSEGLESGVTPCGWQAGPTTDVYGPAPVPANLSARQAQAQGLLTSGTSGPPGTTSSASADLQSSLGSRLQARMPYDGLTLFRLTWKERVTPSGRVICALRASVRPTSGSDCSSWPTPAKQNGTGGARRGLDPRGWNTLQTAAALAGWGTPSATTWGGTAEQHLERKRKAIANGKQMGLVVSCLDHQVQLAASGQTQTGSPAKTKSIGQLNPALSRWLMGLPPAWDDCAGTGMLS